MSADTDDGSGGNSTFKPAPGKRASFLQSLFLFAYHIALGLFLAYAIYHVWPPQPWPEDPSSPAAIARAKARSEEEKAKTPAKPNADANTPTDTVATDTTATTTDTTATATDTTATAASAKTRADGDKTPEVMNSYGGEFPPAFWVFGRRFKPSLETRLILLVLLAGAIGSYVHSASSFVDYLGNRTFISSWGWWYLLRPFIGMMLALVFYFVFRGGFVTAGINQGGDAAASFINPFGVAALAGLVGMFSKVAADKLNEVFLTMFNPAKGHGDTNRGDKLPGDVKPVVSAIDPNVGPAAGGTPVTIKGTGFVDGIGVTFGGAAATAVVVIGATSLTAVTPAHAQGAVDVEVTSPKKQTGILQGGFTFQ